MKRRPAKPSPLLSKLLGRFAGWTHVEFGDDSNPCSDEQRERMPTMMRSALHELCTSAKPSKNAWQIVTDLLNFVETAISLDYIEAHEIAGPLQCAIRGMAEAAIRNQCEGKPIRLNGSTISSVTCMLDVWDQVLCNISEAAARHITLTVQHRSHMIQTGQIKPRDDRIAGM